VTNQHDAPTRESAKVWQSVSRLRLTVDQPDPSVLSARDGLFLAGHLEGTDAPGSAQVRVQVSGGDPVTAAMTPPAPGEVAEGVSWSAYVDVSQLDPGPALLTVVATVHSQSDVVRRQLLVEPSEATRTGGSGFLDVPEDESTIDGDVLLVRGWCLFEDSHVARVEVLLDGVRVGRARLYVDVIVPGSEHKDATVAGFEAFVNVRHLRRGRTSLVSVEATSLKGERWAPAAHTVIWDTPEPLPTADLETVAARNAAVLAEVHSTRSHVVVFTHDLGYGGGQLWLLEILREVQAHKGLGCRVISLADGPLRETLETMGISVHVTTHTPVKNAFSYEGRVHELALLIKSSNGGVVVANTLTVFAAIEAAQRAEVPSLWAIHESIDFGVYCYMAWGPDGFDPRARERVEASFKQPKGLVFEASRTAELFSELRAAAPNYVVDYGVDIDEIDEYRRSVQRAELRTSAGFDEADKVVLVMGTFEPRKAQAAIVAVFDELLVVHENVHLVLVGENGSHYAVALETQISRTRCNSHIRVIPVTSNIYPWYELSDLLLCASDMESLPRSIIEAMAFELPVVSTDVYGIADLIDDGKTGWLTRDRDLEALAGLLHLVLQKPGSELKRVAMAAQAIAHNRHGSQSYGKLLVRALLGLRKDPEFDVGSVLPLLESPNQP